MPCCEYSPIRKPGKKPVTPPDGVPISPLDPVNPPLTGFWPIGIGDAIPKFDVFDEYDGLGDDQTGEPKFIGSIEKKVTNTYL